MDILDKFCQLYAQLHEADIASLGTIYTENVEFIDPITTHHGLDSVTRYLATLIEQAESCIFDIHDTLPSTSAAASYSITWTMHLRLQKSKKLISLEGISLLKLTDGRISYQRDYYDLGEMVYEHVPVLGWIIHKIKSRLAS